MSVICDWTHDLDILDRESAVNIKAKEFQQGSTETLNSGRKPAPALASVFSNMGSAKKMISFSQIGKDVAAAVTESSATIAVAEDSQTLSDGNSDISETRNNIGDFDGDADYGPPLDYTPSVAIGPEEDEIMRHIFRNRMVVVGGPDGVDEAAETERLRRMYNMVRYTDKYKKLQVEKANSQWRSEIEMDIEIRGDSEVMETTEGEAFLDKQYTKDDEETEDEQGDVTPKQDHMYISRSAPAALSTLYASPTFLRLRQDACTPPSPAATTMTEDLSQSAESGTVPTIHSREGSNSSAGIRSSILRASTASTTRSILSRTPSRYPGCGGFGTRRVSFSVKNTVVHVATDEAPRPPPTPTQTVSEPEPIVIPPVKPCSGLSQMIQAIRSMSLSSLVTGPSESRSSTTTVSGNEEPSDAEPVVGQVREVDYNDLVDSYEGAEDFEVYMSKCEDTGRRRHSRGRDVAAFEETDEAQSLKETKWIEGAYSYAMRLLEGEEDDEVKVVKKGGEDDFEVYVSKREDTGRRRRSRGSEFFEAPVVKTPTVEDRLLEEAKARGEAYAYALRLQAAQRKIMRELLDEQDRIEDEKEYVEEPQEDDEEKHEFADNDGVTVLRLSVLKNCFRKLWFRIKSSVSLKKNEKSSEQEVEDEADEDEKEGEDEEVDEEEEYEEENMEKAQVEDEEVQLAFSSQCTAADNDNVSAPKVSRLQNCFTKIWWRLTTSVSLKNKEKSQEQEENEAEEDGMSTARLPGCKGRFRQFWSRMAKKGKVGRINQ